MAKPKIVELAPDQVKWGERRRQDYGDIEQMMQSIKEKGQLQPITIGEDYTLAAGGRRLRAIEQLGDRKVVCVIRKIEDELDLREVELFENIHRKDMTWQERCNAVRDIHTLMVAKHGDKWTQRGTATLLGKSQGAINDQLQLAGAMEFIPELSTMPTADAARKKLNRLVEDVSTKQKIKEAQSQESYKISTAKYAEDHYKVGDAIEGMRGVGNGICHFAEVDPPYGIALGEKRADKNEGFDTSTAIETYHEVPPEDYPEFILAAAEQVYRILDVNAFCVWWYGPTWHHEVKTILKAVGFKVYDIPGIWYKIDTPATTAAPNVHLGNSYEPFWVCRKGNPALIKKGRSNVFPFRGIPPAQRIHATERPVELMEEILETFTIPSARVLIPFLGSGNTLIAAYKKERVGFGWDKSEEHKNRFLNRVIENFPDRKVEK